MIGLDSWKRFRLLTRHRCGVLVKKLERVRFVLILCEYSWSPVFRGKYAFLSEEFGVELLQLLLHLEGHVLSHFKGSDVELADAEAV